VRKKAALFVHLHCHSGYSLQDGLIRFSDDFGRPSEFTHRLAKDDTPAMALTDHGNLHGAVEFYQCCREVGIKPIIGCVSSGSREDGSGVIPGKKWFF
jgi:DNA polymerase-3 subunit alpha